ncbi:MAG: cell wall hydrolase [Clostridiaceae bacterium]|nr:cell wall hydrolase [Clostridiaceae bacterium]
MKRAFSILLLFSLLALLALPVSAAGITVSYNGSAMRVESVLKNGTTYVPLRTFCDEIGGCKISWNNSTRQATVSGECSMTVTAGTRSARCAGTNVTLSAPSYIAGGSLWVPIRALAAALECGIGWTQRTQTVSLDPGGFIWLARIIQAEAGLESYAGKIAVGNVVLNRVNSSEFPNSIYNVIFDSSYGGQFTPVINGTINCTPSAESYAAARACLAGESTAGKSLYFFNPTTSTRQGWIEQNCTLCASIGSHVFYA